MKLRYLQTAVAVLSVVIVFCVGYGFYRVVDKIRSMQAAWTVQVSALESELKKSRSDRASYQSLADQVSKLETELKKFRGVLARYQPEDHRATFLGNGALQSHKTGAELVAVGNGALNSFDGGGGATAVGSRSMASMIDPRDVTALGARTLANATTGVGDTAIGFRSLEHATVARNNTGVGDSTLWQYQGIGSVAVGYVAAEYWREGDGNVAVGVAAARKRGSGAQNVFIGAASNSFPEVIEDKITGDGGVGAGDGNIAVGYQSALSVTGNDNVFLGRNSGQHAEQKNDVTNSIAIGSGTYTSKNNQVVIGNENSSEFVIGGITISKNKLLSVFTD